MRTWCQQSSWLSCGPQLGPRHPEVVVVEVELWLSSMLQGSARWDLHAVSPSIHPCPQDLPPDDACVLPGLPSPSSRFLCITEVSKLAGKVVLNSLSREMMLRRLVHVLGAFPGPGRLAGSEGWRCTRLDLIRCWGTASWGGGKRKAGQE